ncbi:hypothetical protein BDR07DRAFT_601492 [Suillus spraguei]|nr:hypothetical protein BDR07DRAFT_601492 [Suillus spraguei]
MCHFHPRTILGFASSVDLLVVSLLHLRSLVSDVLGSCLAARTKSEPGVISSFIATNTRSLTSYGHYHYLHQVKWGFSVINLVFLYRISISFFVFGSNWGKGSALCFEPGLGMIPSWMAFQVIAFPCIANPQVHMP